MTERKWPAWMFVAIVDIAMDGHRSERELRKYSSGPTCGSARARRPIVKMMLKYAMTIAKSIMDGSLPVTDLDRTRAAAASHRLTRRTLGPHAISCSPSNPNPGHFSARQRRLHLQEEVVMVEGFHQVEIAGIFHTLTHGL